MADLLLVEIAARVRAIATAQIRSIAAAEWITPVPSAPSLVAGVTQIRGHILPVLDLACPPRQVHPDDPLLVLEYGPARAALRVDRVLGDEPTGPGSPRLVERLDVGALFDRVRGEIAG